MPRRDSAKVPAMPVEDDEQRVVAIAACPKGEFPDDAHDADGLAARTRQCRNVEHQPRRHRSVGHARHAGAGSMAEMASRSYCAGSNAASADNAARQPSGSPSPVPTQFNIEIDKR